MEAVLSVISTLETTTITKEQLETTRLAKYINQLRKRTSSTHLARRAKSLLKRWREMVGMSSLPQPQQQDATSTHPNDIAEDEKKPSNAIITDVECKDRDTSKVEVPGSVGGSKRQKMTEDSTHKRKTMKHSITSNYVGLYNEKMPIHSSIDGESIDITIDVDQKTKTQNLLVSMNPASIQQQQQQLNLRHHQQQQQQYHHQHQHIQQHHQYQHHHQSQQQRQQGQTNFVNLLNDLNNSSSNSLKSSTTTNNNSNKGIRHFSSSNLNMETLILDQSSNSIPSSENLNKRSITSPTAIASNHLNNINDNASQCVVIDLQDSNSGTYDLTMNHDNTMNTAAPTKALQSQLLNNGGGSSNRTSSNGIAATINLNNSNNKNSKKSKRELKRKERDRNITKIMNRAQDDIFDSRGVKLQMSSHVLPNTNTANRESNIVNDSRLVGDNITINIDNNASGMYSFILYFS